MEDRPIFDHGKADLGIQMACEQFDKLGLTLTERFWVSHHIATAAAGMLGKKYADLAELIEGRKGDEG